MDFRLPMMSDRISHNVIELLDPENVGITIEIALISCLEAKIYVVVIYSWVNII